MLLFSISLVVFALSQTYLNLRLLRRVAQLEDRSESQEATTQKLVAVVGGGDSPLLLGAPQAEAPTTTINWADVENLKKMIRRASSLTKFHVFMAGFPTWENLSLTHMDDIFKLLPASRQDDALKAYHARQDHKRDEARTA